MRRLARMGLATLGLALAAPTLATADSPDGPLSATAVTKPHKHRKGLFRRNLCPDCQRAEVLAKDGVLIPPPPAIPTGMVAQNGVCNDCQGGTVMADGSMIVVDTNEAPGYAVIGEAAPGAEPAPIGVVQANYAGAGVPAPGRASTRDPMLTPTSMAPDPVRPPGHNRPHVIGHALGLTAIGRSSREARERRRREAHAMIPYGPQAQQPVTDVPASLVYGRGAH